MNKIENNKIINGDAMEVMKNIPEQSIDLILCDLPYGTTDCAWDKILPVSELWEHYKRIIKFNGAILLFAQQPFATKLISEAGKLFRYELVWEKSSALGFLNAKKMPLRAHELILVFYKKLPTYNPQFMPGKPYITKDSIRKKDTVYANIKKKITTINEGKRYPRDVIRIDREARDGRYHPTQKPLKLLEYLVKTYSNENDLVLDNTCGSGSTCLAAKNLNRNYIGIELDEEYYKIAVERCLSQ